MSRYPNLDDTQVRKRLVDLIGKGRRGDYATTRRNRACAFMDSLDPAQIKRVLSANSIKQLDKKMSLHDLSVAEPRAILDLVDRGMAIDTCPHSNYTMQLPLLGLAASEGNLDFAKELLNRGADPNQPVQKNTPWASPKTQIASIIETSLHQDDELTALHMVQLLLDHGANPDGPDGCLDPPLLGFARNMPTNTSAARMLIQNGANLEQARKAADTVKAWAEDAKRENDRSSGDTTIKQQTVENWMIWATYVEDAILDQSTQAAPGDAAPKRARRL